MALIVPISGADRGGAVATVVAAFVADPVERWLWPEDDAYDTAFPEFVDAFGGDPFERGTAWSVGGSEAVALWLEPGADGDEEAVVGVLTETVEAEKHDDLFAAMLRPAGVPE